MALVNGTNYDHIDLHAASGGDVTRHKLQDSEARAMIGPTEASSTASAAHPAGSYFIYNNKLYQATSDIASGGTITPNTNCKEAPLGGEVSDLKSALTNSPKLLDSDSTADLDVADEYGNVLLRLSNGDVETKNFRGFDYITYKSSPQTYSGTLPFTLTVNHHFHKGDRVVLHVERGANPWGYGAYVNYYEDNRPIMVEGRGDSAWTQHTIMDDTETVSAVYTGSVSTADMEIGTIFTLEVSLLGDLPILPTVITVKQDGTGDYTVLRDALDDIGIKANDVLNPYRIEIYPGTYDVMDDYSDEEIAAATYTQTGFVGPKLLNGMTLVGMGNTPDETVLNGELDTETWDLAVRGAISTLNCQGSCGFENLTIIARNLRYCVHDDFNMPCTQRIKRYVKNCVFRGYNMSYNPGTTYGAGAKYSTGEYTFENCDFGENGGLHTMPALLEPVFVRLINCKGHGFRIGDNETTSPVVDYSIYQFENCNFLWINHRMEGSSPHVIVRGSGGNSPLYQFDPQTIYDTGDITIVPNTGKESQYTGVGTVVEWYVNAGHGPRFREATSYDTARGIIVYEDSDNTYIQTQGYVRTDRTSITMFNIGDYVGVVNGLAAIVQDENLAIGRITYIDNDSKGYIKLDWKG